MDLRRASTAKYWLLYVVLNPLRAGLVDRPEKYRWNSLGYHIQTENKERFLSTDFGLKEFNIKSKKERIRRYRRYVYEAGALNRSDKMQTMVIDEKLLQKNAKKNLRSAGSIDSDTAPAILRIRASSDQRGLWLKTTSDLNLYFFQGMKKDPNRLKDWMGCIR